MNLFSSSPKEKEAVPAPEAVKQPSGKTGNVDDLESFVDYVVRTLVDKPESVKINMKEGQDSSAIIEINCAKEDMGKVIGKSGKTIMAIRSLASGAGGRLGKRVSVEIIE